MIATILSVLEIAYAIGVVAYIVLQKRSAVSTLAWIVTMVAFPLLGIVVYVLIGPRRVHRNRLRRLRARIRVRSEMPSRATEALAGARESASDMRSRQLMTLATRAGEAPRSSCIDVRILQGGEETFSAMEVAIRAARHHVHLEYYIFETDVTGTRFRDLLVEKAKSGVEVLLLVDAMGSRAAGARFFAPLFAAGGRVAWFNRVSFARLRPRLLNFRTHRKIVICDGSVGFTGGINVTDTENETVRPDAFRDTHVRLEGAAVRWLQIVFFEDWHYANGRSNPTREHFPEVTTGDYAVQIVASGPDSDTEAIRNLYFAAIASATQRVLVTTPYFVPDESILTALGTAAMRGVDVRLLVPRMSDSRLVTICGRSYYDELLKRGVRVYEYLPRMLHAKTLVVDGCFAAIGTANMDNRSFRLNFEVSAILYDELHAAELGAIFERDLESAAEVLGVSRERRSLPTRLAEAGARLLSPLL